MTRAVRRAAVAGKLGLLGLLVVLAGCASVPPAPPSVDLATAWSRARAEAWAPRRFKALFRGEVVPRVGVAVRGYLSVWWDGETLVWRASAPLGGAGKGGVLWRDADEASGLFPGPLSARDALAAILGVADVAAAPGASPAWSNGAFRLPLADGLRHGLLDGAGQVVGLDLPGGVTVRFEPGEGVPRKITARGPEGGAVLTLESFGAWPAGERIPGTGGA